MINISTTFG